MLIHVPAEQYAAVLDAVAGEVLAAAKMDRPPVDAFAVARTLGITVAEDVHQSSRGRYVRLRVKGRRGRRSSCAPIPGPSGAIGPWPTRSANTWRTASITC